MEITILHQRAGISPFYKEMSDTLRNNPKSVRIIVAYLTWGGIKLIHKELEHINDLGGRIEIIFGYDRDSFDYNAISYLIQRITNGKFYLFQTLNLNYIFHSKIYIFNMCENYSTFIGSNNFTNGGLNSNSEVCIKLEYNNKDSKIFNEIESIWNTYKNYTTPFKKNNLLPINNKNIKYLISDSINNNKTKQKLYKKKSTLSFHKFPKIEILSPDFIDNGYSLRKNSGKTVKQRTLLFEVLKETGADGSQVQIPKYTVNRYFGVSSIGHQTIELEFNKGIVRPAIICHFTNNTHRITISEVIGLKRPLLLEFFKVKNNYYRVKIHTGKMYNRLLSNCKNQTRKGAKRWVIK